MASPTPSETGSSSSQTSYGFGGDTPILLLGGPKLDIVPRPWAGTYTAERYRVGIPALKPLPLIQTAAYSFSAAYTEIRRLREPIRKILGAWNIHIQDKGPCLYHRHKPGETPTDGDLTAHIIAPWNGDEDAQRWYNAAADIRDLLGSNSITQDMDIKVELVTWKVVIPKLVDSVEENHPIIEAWDEILNLSIQVILKESPKVDKAWCSLGVKRTGYHFEGYCSMPVTVSIMVDFDLERPDWLLAEQQIRALLDDCGMHEVEIEFYHGGIWPFCEEWD